MGAAIAEKARDALTIAPSKAPLITKREAEDDETVKALAEALRDYGQYFDQALTALAADHFPAEIWSDAQEWEWPLRAKALLHLGTRNHRVAAVVHVALNLHETVALWAWLGGDTWRTLKFVRDHGVAVQHSRRARPMLIFGGKRDATAAAAPGGQPHQVNGHQAAPGAPQGVPS